MLTPRKLVLAAMVSGFLIFGAAACAPQDEEPAETPEVQEEATPTEEPTAGLSYNAELGPVQGVTSSATGSSTVEMQADTASFTVTVQDLNNVNAAHIHVAEEPGGSGPPVVWFYPPDGQAPQLKQGLTSGELASGTFDASDLVGPMQGMTLGDLQTAIDEGRAYVNVHTEAYPDGEISGFLAK